MRKGVLITLIIVICLGAVGCNNNTGVVDSEKDQLIENTQSDTNSQSEDEEELDDEEESDNDNVDNDTIKKDDVENDSKKADSNKNSEIFKYSIEYAGDEYQMPVAVSEVIENGWSIKQSVLELEVKPGDMREIEMDRDDIEALCYVVNYGDEVNKVKDCYLVTLRSQFSVCEVEMKVGDDIYYGMSEDDFKEVIEQYDVEVVEATPLIMYKLVDPDNEHYCYNFAIKEGKLVIIYLFYMPDELD